MRHLAYGWQALGWPPWPRPAGAGSIVGWRLVDRDLVGLGSVTYPLCQRHQHRFQLVDLLLLLVDALVQRLHQVFLVRQFDFDVDETVFAAHGMLLHWLKQAFYRSSSRRCLLQVDAAAQ